MDPRVELLTKREIEMLHHVYLGRKTAEIAAIEGIAEQTVLNRLQDGRGKLGGVDRRRAALIVAEAKGWIPGIKPTPAENTLSSDHAIAPTMPVSQEERTATTGEVHSERERGVFVQTLQPDWPRPRRRDGHDTLNRISMLLVRIAFLLAATVALLWVYGKA